MVILFPSSYLNKNKVDEEFQKEYEAALANDLNVVLFNQIDWDENRKLSISLFSKKENMVVCALYRGWMMKPEEYNDFFYQLEKNGIKLITSPIEYTNMHVFKNSFPFIKRDGPKTLFYEKIEDIDLDFINQKFNKFMVKDFVKSVKGTDFPKYFQKPNKEFFNHWMEKFKDYRGNLFTGGIQIKEYLDLKLYHGIPNEYRIFYANGNPISISRNSNQPLFTKELSEELVLKYTNLPSPFYTIDFIECKDGDFKVIETGDGSVSGLSPKQSEYHFYRCLKTIFDNMEIK